MGVYRKYQKLIENALFPAVLLFYPFLTVNQGIDVADSTYSLTNFQYFGSMDGTWMVATFLSNVAGWFLMRLPFGDTLLGIKIYTTLVQAALALMVYFGLRKRIPAPLLFMGEFLALGLCWCPSTVLYNYLTYFLMTAAILLIYRGLTSGKDSALCKKQWLYLTAAGICLGANVAVRMPNVVQAAFILVVWYGIVLAGRRRDQEAAGRTALPWRALIGATGWCLLGYVIGFGVPLAVICLRYGVSAYPDMVTTMFAMTEQAVDYKPTSMLTGMFGDYGRGLYWLAFAAVCGAAAGFAFFVRERLYGAGEKDRRGGRKTGKHDAVDRGRTAEWDVYRITGVIIKSAYIMLLLVLLRFYWGRGMFHFRYYQYGNGSIYYPAVLLLIAMIVAALLSLAGKKVCAEQKILAALVLGQIFLTPLGSNNDLYPIINNLFVAAPFLLWAAWGRYASRHAEDGDADLAADRRKRDRERAAVYDFVWFAPVVFLTVFVTVQSIGSHANFVFQDGIYGEERNTRVRMPRKAAGVYTTLENGALLEELSAYIQEAGLSGREAITYGELPGLPYLLDMPPALSTGWPDLESYRMTEYTRDMAALEEKMGEGREPPVIIVSSSVAAYWSDDGEAINWFGVDTETMDKDEKQRILWDFVGEYGYEETFGNARYVVYRKPEG